MSDLKSTAAILEDIEKETPLAEGDLLTLSNGVIVRVKAVPPFLAQRVESKFKYPPVPKTHNPDKDRYEENPLDPNYLQAREDIDAEKGLAIIDLMVGLGTEVVFVPPDYASLEDDSWVADMEFFAGESVPTSARARYLYWMKYVVITNPKDFALIAKRVSGKMGVTEEAVADAMAQFKSDEERGANRGSSA